MLTRNSVQQHFKVTEMEFLYVFMFKLFLLISTGNENLELIYVHVQVPTNCVFIMYIVESQPKCL
jgi:hypothetical protein